MTGCYIMTHRCALNQSEWTLARNWCISELGPAIDLAIGERCQGPILTTSAGQGLDRHGAGRIVRRVARRAGLAKKIGPHALRHAFIICTAFSARGTTESGPCRIVPQKYPSLRKSRMAGPVPGSFSLRCCS